MRATRLRATASRFAGGSAASQLRGSSSSDSVARVDDQRVDEIATAFRDGGYELHGPEQQPDGSYTASYVVSGGMRDADCMGTGQSRLEAAEDAWAKFVAAEEAAGEQ